MAWNDPDWGKKNNGPPDLDELWRKFNDKLNSLFGIKTPKPNKPVPVFMIPVTLLIIVAIWLATGMYIVNAGERGVVLRFGKLIDTTQPGLNWHLPYPIESVNVVNVEQVRTVEIGYRENVQNKLLKESLMLTDDENIVDIQFSVQYTITNPEDYLFNNRSPDDAVRQVAESIMSEIVGKSKMDYVLYEGRADIADRASSSQAVPLEQVLPGRSRINGWNLFRKGPGEDNTLLRFNDYLLGFTLAAGQPGHSSWPGQPFSFALSQYVNGGNLPPAFLAAIPHSFFELIDACVHITLTLRPAS